MIRLRRPVVFLSHNPYNSSWLAPYMDVLFLRPRRLSNSKNTPKNVQICSLWKFYGQTGLTLTLTLIKQYDFSSYECWMTLLSLAIHSVTLHGSDFTSIPQRTSLLFIYSSALLSIEEIESQHSNWKKYFVVKSSYQLSEKNTPYICWRLLWWKIGIKGHEFAHNLLW